ncbi:MAG: ComF family protein [Ruminococcaceae bacterium]|nr:ComF family protein [Oscillospiraceae bacterium]
MKKREMLWRVFFPEKCPLCGETLKINEDFCLCCGSDEVRLSDHCCESCGKERELCSCETEHTVPLSHITGVFTYDGIIKSKLLSFKFGGRKSLYRYFGDCVAERVAQAFAKADFDTVTFVPSSAQAVKERGYNPAQLIAVITAKKLFLPCEELLIKSKETEKQHRLKAKERITNITGSVSPKKGSEISGKTVLLCDDIKTTGATLKECSDVLFSMGAKDVYCATVAVTSNLNLFDLDKVKKNK